MSVAAWPTLAWAGGRAATAMMTATMLVAAVTSGTGLLAVRRMTRADPAGRLATGLRAGVERLVLTLVLAAAVPWLAGIEAKWFLGWVAIAYVPVTRLETLALVGWLKTCERHAC